MTTTIQHLIIDSTDYTASIDWGNRPTAQDASELLLGFEVDAYSTEDGEGDIVLITLDEEAKKHLQALVDEGFDENGNLIEVE